MNNNLSSQDIAQYRRDGFLVIENFLSPDELAFWRTALDEAVKKRNGNKMPDRKEVYGKGDENDKSYYDNVFDQLINLWQDNEKIKQIMLDERLGKMAAELAGVDGIRIWHDQALIKKPWANPTSWHLDTPYWSFSDRRALSIWVALDDATYENGCLFFIPESYQKTTFENPGIGKNMGAIFTTYPEFKTSKSIAAPMKAGSCSFHNGLTIHGAHANMTPGFRRAMTCAYMPDGNAFNGTPNILSEEAISRLKVGDLLNDNEITPLIYTKI
ncbi:Ectoine hydroxylase-related dioxygenase, phytanoyl-CoA dioxygenase (PhyH) family [Mucilaginibacter lappiensis]|uniref:Ectoine hydroxylase-related dioxygenase (Phytanoyl-CoA dioxygenase family) n=1 Tax=Mucilaginibacter lappiensis TaxID=354630 RepID=A0ABR6PD20_9SPHI|nr:phytanoyl-CoA dioxygenase family protein [Mucilaginibacter lappiensis]MBB6107650.1 ectoine hydroxylase-related dioxygenase (phytanoyl-CoA dioxygenase family) [Mucilaginibacter lappiensis]SIQ01684.1 Ectoine hydroxylase-related dioxygenase, phytanoyl-CoA dioxygenase (PhyH) family [Mucilaginibacter lappiensis]